MAYNNTTIVPRSTGLRPVDIFTRFWKILAFEKALLTFHRFNPASWILYIPLRVAWKYVGMQLLTAVNQKAPSLSWVLHLRTTSLDSFEADFRQAWEDDYIDRQGQSVVHVTIFVGDNAISVPIMFDKDKPARNSDAKTFQQLLMWYSWMQYKGGFGEVIIPRRLVRVDKVSICSKSQVICDRIETFDLGRNASCNVVNFLDPRRIDKKQHFQSDRMLSNTDTEGLEFVRAWDRSKVSIICMIPAVMSLLFASIWIPVSVARFGVDAQIAVQTAFTVASYIVTAGALLIALFAFLDGQAI